MASQMKTSRDGLEFIKRFEGLQEKAVKLSDGSWSVGYGHVRSAHEGKEVSEKDAEALLQYDLQEVEEVINSQVLTPLNQNQFDALVSFAFNIGLESFEQSELLGSLNEGQLLRAAESMEQWRKARVGGKLLVVDALVRRRAAEKALFLTPDGGHRSASSIRVRPSMDSSVPVENLERDVLAEVKLPRKLKPSSFLKMDTDDAPASDVDAKAEDSKPRAPKKSDKKGKSSTPDVTADSEEKKPIIPVPDTSWQKRPDPMPTPADNIVAFRDGGSDADKLLSTVSPRTMDDSQDTSVMDRPAAKLGEVELENGADVDVDVSVDAASDAGADDKSETSQEEILDIVRRIREMTQNAPKVATLTEAEDVSDDNDTTDAEVVTQPVAEKPATDAQAFTKKQDDQQAQTMTVSVPNLSSTPEKSGVKPVAEKHVPTQAVPPVAEPPLSKEEDIIAPPAPVAPTPVAPAPVAAKPAPKPVAQDPLAAAVNPQAPSKPKTPVKVVRRDPDLEIPAEGLMAPMFEGEESWDLTMVHDAPPNNKGHEDIIFLSDDRSRQVTIGGLIGLVSFVMGMKSILGGSATVMTGALPVLVGILFMVGAGYFIFQKYQKFLQLSS